MGAQWSTIDGTRCFVVDRSCKNCLTNENNNRMDRTRKGRRRSSVHTLGFPGKIMDAAPLEIFKIQLRITGRWLLVQRPTRPGTLNNLDNFLRSPQSRHCIVGLLRSFMHYLEVFSVPPSWFTPLPTRTTCFPSHPHLLFSSISVWSFTAKNPLCISNSPSPSRPYMIPPLFPHPPSSAYSTPSLCDRRQRRVEPLSLEQEIMALNALASLGSCTWSYALVENLNGEGMALHMGNGRFPTPFNFSFRL